MLQDHSVIVTASIDFSIDTQQGLVSVNVEMIAYFPIHITHWGVIGSIRKQNE